LDVHQIGARGQSIIPQQKTTSILVYGEINRVSLEHVFVEFVIIDLN